MSRVPLFFMGYEPVSTLLPQDFCIGMNIIVSMRLRSIGRHFFFLIAS